MSQDAIWDYYQTEGVKSFSEASARLEFLVRKLRPGQRVLNIGVGSGELERLAKAGQSEIWSLDPSERAIERLSSELSMGARAKAGYSQNMPFPDNHFDVIIMTEVLEHLDPDALEPTLDEVRRTLRSGGRFIGTVPADEDLNNALVVCPDCEHKFHRWGHQRKFGTADLRELLATRFYVNTVEDHFFVRWGGASLKEKLSGLIKKFLSYKRIGQYGTCRNIFFCATNR